MIRNPHQLGSYSFVFITTVKYVLLCIQNYGNLKVISLFIQRKLAVASFTKVAAGILLGPLVLLLNACQLIKY